MSTAKVAISIDSSQLKKLDYYVKKKVFKNRSQAIQQSISQILQHLEHKRLEQECEKLDAQYEQNMAEIGMDEDLESWPKY